MIDLKTFFKNHFDTKEVSDDNLRKFAEDHLQRLVAQNNVGLYGQMIQDTQVLYDKFNTFIKQEDQTFSLQQGKTLLTDNIIAEFLQLVSRKEGAVRSEFGKDSPEYQEFFPLGVSEYHQITKANAELLMERMRNKGLTYVSALGQGFVASFTDVLNRYLIARNEQLQAMGNVDTLKSDAQRAREDLSMQLMKNLMQIAVNHIGHLDRLDDYFSQEMIRRRNSSTDGTVRETIAENTIQNIESQGLTPTTEVNFTNLGSVPLYLGMSNDEMSLDRNLALLIQVGGSINTNLSVLGSGTCLNVENATGVVGEYEVLLI